MSHASSYALGHPKAKVLLIATELCGLTFLTEDRSKSNLVATALFADGSAAALVCGDEADGEGLEIVDTRSRLYPDSLDVMGWNIISEGMQVVFARRIPSLVEQYAHDDLTEFLANNDLTLDLIDRFLFHPGGTKVIEAYEKVLGMSNGALDLSREVLRDYGNVSSVTVLMVLCRYLEEYGFGCGGYGLVSALGPGFSSESLLLRL